MHLIAVGSREFNWGINLKEMARIWKGGCIIRARFLDTIMQAYERRPDLPNLLLDKEFGAALRRAQNSWRRAVMIAQHLGIPVPAMASALNYFDSYRTADLPQNLTQAQRDFFGAHTYERKDRPDAGFVHSDWAKLAAGDGAGAGD
jgi:6-phosphogluconate dehydrogenase